MHRKEPLNRLTGLRDTLLSVQAACEANSRTLARSGRNAGDLAGIQALADELLDDFVLRFGFIGDTGTGKSLLIGALIGKAYASPYNPYPETGNIAVLRITSSDEISETSIEDYRLNFLDESDLHDCLRRLLSSTLEELTRLSIDPTAEQGARQLLQTQGSISVAAVVDWLHQVWQELPEQAGDPNEGHTRKIDFRMRLLELARFTLAWHYLGRMVTGRKNVSVPREVAEAAMVLPRTSEATTLAEITEQITRIVSGDSSGDFPRGLPRGRLRWRRAGCFIP